MILWKITINSWNKNPDIPTPSSSFATHLKRPKAPCGSWADVFLWSCRAVSWTKWVSGQWQKLGFPKCEESAWWNIMWVNLSAYIYYAKGCLKVVLWTPMWPASPFWKIHKRWKVRFGVTHLQVDRRKSSVGLRDACKDVFLYVVENLQWISRVNEGCMQTQALKTMLFFPGSSFQIVIIDPKVLR